MGVRVREGVGVVSREDGVLEFEWVERLSVSFEESFSFSFERDPKRGEIRSGRATGADAR